MTLEYILLLSFYVAVVMGVMVSGPKESFINSAPRLAARVEVHLATGDGFIPATTGSGNRWLYSE